MMLCQCNGPNVDMGTNIKKKLRRATDKPKAEACGGAVAEKLKERQRA